MEQPNKCLLPRRSGKTIPKIFTKAIYQTVSRYSIKMYILNCYIYNNKTYILMINTVMDQ